MKFLQKEFADLTHILEKNSFSSEQYQFTKKKGWVFLTLISAPSHFKFHRKEHTKLQTGKFISTIEYSVEDHQGMTENLNWSDVLHTFESWLNFQQP